MNDTTQDAVFQFLASASSYDGVPVTRIDTHAAVVFLAGARALKVKRAVRYPFLDFTTLAQRRAACEEELVANHPFAPALYRRVATITRTPDGMLRLDGDGPAVEYAVEMVRFDETQTLDRLADAGPLDPMLADALGHLLADAHARTDAANADDWLALLPALIAQNGSELAAASLFADGPLAALTAASFAAFEHARPVLAQRAAHGWVRRGHGDLHLGNIARIDGRPVPFDALEFDPRLASGDLMYDLAFLLMDLIERKQAAAANRVLNRYLAERREPDDVEGLAALPLFVSLRAAIRTKVTAARRAFVPASRHAALEEQARTYFALALAALQPPPPRLVAVGGLSGTGKSALARALAPAIAPMPGAVILRSDVERKAMFGVAETHRLPAPAYAPEVTGRVYSSLAREAERILAAGHSVVVDAVFARDAERAAMEAAAIRQGAAFVGLMLRADLETRLARINMRVHDASDADEAIARQQEHYAHEAHDAHGWHRIDATGTLEQTCASASAALDRPSR